jgi:hypothetical protein
MVRLTPQKILFPLARSANRGFPASEQDVLRQEILCKVVEYAAK